MIIDKAMVAKKKKLPPFPIKDSLNCFMQVVLAFFPEATSPFLILMKGDKNG